MMLAQFLNKYGGEKLIKFFMWLMENGAILTKDNLIKRNWMGNPMCHFCDQESIVHIFFTCPTAKVIWAGCLMFPGT